MNGPLAGRWSRRCGSVIAFAAPASELRNYVPICDTFCATAVCMLLTFGASLLASTVAISVLSYDSLIPRADSAPGVNAFSLSNHTGNPGTGGFALPPEFPVLTPVTLLNATVLLTGAGVTPSLSLGDIAPGPLALTSSLEFPETAFMAIHRHSLLVPALYGALAMAQVFSDLFPSVQPFRIRPWHGGDFLIRIFQVRGPVEGLDVAI